MTTALFVLPDKSVSFFNHIQPLIATRFQRFAVEGRMPMSATELSMWAQAKSADVIVTTSLRVAKLVDPFLEGTETENTGTILSLPSVRKDRTYKVLLAPPLISQFGNGGKFLIDHHLQRVTGKVGVMPDRLDWQLLTADKLEMAILTLQTAMVCAVDIETSKEGRKITSVAYTAALKGKDGGIVTKTFVVRCDHTTYPFCITAIRRLNATKCPKVMHNGQYDCAYFLRFNAPVRNYLFDTYTLMNCLFQELPKTLHFCASFFLNNYRFWKDESATNLYEYNAKDTHATVWVFLAMLEYCNRPSNQYALRNYLEVFPKVFPAFHCGMTGLPVTEETRLRLRAEEQARMDAAEKSCQTMLGWPAFNPNSPKQTLTVIQALGLKKAESSDKKAMTSFAELGPLQSRLADAIKAYRASSKAIGTYFDVELWDGRLYYTLDPSGTLSNRMASRESAFWVGTQVQNIPGYARAMVDAPAGKKLGAVDKAQAESYCTAYIAREPKLITVVTTSPDFHCQNASMFFGIPFEQLYDVAKKKKLRPDIRDLAKKVNHGANYNMGEDVLLETMGMKSVLSAQRLLDLPAKWTPRLVCKYLLQCFDKAYPRIRGDWQQELIQEVQTTGKLVAPDGWTIRTFMQPWKNKLDLNSCVSLKPQGLSARLVNKALFRIWRELQMGKWYGKFQLLAQIHDEILFMADDDIAEEAAKTVADMMVVPIVIHNRTMTIPSTWAVDKNWKNLK
jgi:DNA polymerase I-like protein with 3'-5' exonuclease and polymerase domains